MIERFVFIKLRAEDARDELRAELQRETLTIFSSIPSVESVRCGVPADDAARQAWDLVIVVRFRQLADVQGYRESAPHVRYLEKVLGERREVLKAWNFDVREA